MEPPATYRNNSTSNQGFAAPKVADTGAREQLSGAVERVTFHSEDSGFCVIRVKVRGHRELVTVVGSTGSVSAGEFVECDGEWINDTKHGMQFKARRLAIVPPSTVDGMEKYLGSGMIRGIGPHFAKQLVKAFGTDVFDVIESKPQLLLGLPGIGQKRMENVIAGWTEQKAVRRIMVFLQSHGLGTSRAVRIYKTYGDEAVEKVTENPYRLALDINGIGFKTADALAQRLGMPKESPARAAAGLRHMLQELSTRGHCACTTGNLIETTAEALEISPSIIESALNDEVAAGGVISEARDDNETWIFLPALHRAEQSVARNLVRLFRGTGPAAHLDADTVIPEVEVETGLLLSQSQKQAVATALSSKVLVITGGPGVGKTTIINAILKIITRTEASILLCAPTGRAAKRLSESTAMEAKTIHRLLEFDPRQGGFKRTKENPLETNLLVVDESSMIDVVLMNQLLNAVPSEASVIFVGDVDQLPSVGPGNVLSDMINSGTLPVVRLTEIFRQAASSRIIVNAHRINQGLMPLTPEDKSLSDFYFIECQTPEEIMSKLKQVVCKRIPDRFGFDPVHDVQVLTPMNRGGLGSRSLNAELQKLLNLDNGSAITRFGWAYKRGDKVIQTQNNYDKDVFNGDIGSILSVDADENKLVIVFEGREIEYDASDLDEVMPAYAISIHKSQGSEYPAVVLPIATAHYMMLERNLLYTGVTRGKKLVVVIGQPKALQMAVKNLRSSARLTALKDRIGQMFDIAF